MSKDIDDSGEERLPDSLSAKLAEQLRPQWPASARASALRERVMSSVSGAQAGAGAAVATLRSADRRWEERWPGIEICTLREDAGGRSFLMRMRPGSVLPAHKHSRDEESLLLEGEAWISDDTCLHAGDYQFMPAGQLHPDMRSPAGCIVFVRSEPSFKPLITPGLIARFLQFRVKRWWR